MRPFKLKPAFKDYIWGGNRLKTEYNKQFHGDVLAESWEVSAHPDGQSTIACGEYQGMMLGDFVLQFPQSDSDFPILIKLIDSAQALSIQVHPDDAYARAAEGDSGKTEMWYILDSQPGGYIYYGFKETASSASMESALADGSITDMLRKVEAKKGDVFFIPAGTIHAIGPGLIIAEVQQSSNSTYRVYDYGRLGADGKPRPLHIQKALDVTNMQPMKLDAPGAGWLEQDAEHALYRLASCEYFTADRLSLHGGYTSKADGFVALLCIEGGIIIEGEQPLSMGKGDSAFIPAGTGDYILSGEGECLLVSKPD